MCVFGGECGTLFASARNVLSLQPILLRRAAEIAGGTAELCELLGVPYNHLELWQNGRATLPDPVFLKVVDLILRDDIARASHDRRQRLREDGARFLGTAPKQLRR